MTYYDNVPLVDGNGDTFYPQTKTNSVYSPDGTETLDSILADVNLQLDALTGVGTGTGDMLMSIYDTDGDGVVDLPNTVLRVGSSSSEIQGIPANLSTCVTDFTMASTETDITSGETTTTILGKILKSINTFRTAIGNINNNLATVNCVISNLISGSVISIVSAKKKNNRVVLNMLVYGTLTQSSAICVIDQKPVSTVYFCVTSTGDNINFYTMGGYIDTSGNIGINPIAVAQGVALFYYISVTYDC